MKPLWSIAAFVTSAAFITSVLAQLLVASFEQHGASRAGAKAVDTPLTLARGALIVQAALALLVVVVLKRYPLLRARVADRARISWLAVTGSLGLMLGLAPLANELGVRFAEALHQSPENTEWVSRLVRGATNSEFALLAVVLTILPALVEEYLFRGVLLGALLGAPAWVALGLQAAAFGTFHMDPAQGMATFILGLGFGFARTRTGTMLAAVVSHGTYNSIVLATMRYARQSSSDVSTHQSLGLLAGGILLSAACAFGLTRVVNHPSEEPS